MRLDLHRHLEGSHSPAALAAATAAFGIQDPVLFDAANQRPRTPAELTSSLVMSGPTDDATVFYRCIQRSRAAYVSPEAIELLARLAFEEAAADTDGFEMRVSLFSMTRTLLENERVVWRDLAPAAFAERARVVLLAVLGARDTVERTQKKPMLVRLGFSRTFESEAHYRAMAAILPEHRGALSGLDVLGIVSGPEREPLPAGLRAILTELRPHFPDLTLHAGEFEGHRLVDAALELEPQGIGHGVHAVQSDATLERLAAEGVTLEVCPTSNRLLIPSALARLEDLRGAAPLVALQRAGVHCVLGSDDPVPTNTSFTTEWALAGRLGADLTRLEADIDRRFAQLPKR